MQTQTAERLRPFGTTIFAEMTKLALDHKAVNLSQGFPDFDGPLFVKQAAQVAIDAGRNQYARPSGEIPLVEAIAADVEDRLGVSYDPLAEITITCGCTEAVPATMLGLINPGDEVVLFEPYYDSYRASVALAGGVPRFVAMREQEGRLTFDRDELRAAVTDSTRAILVNTPHNPTGAVLTREELTEIADLAKEHDALVISDEVYEHLVFEGRHVSIASLPRMRERTVVLSSFGKTFSMTGWKIGWAMAPAELTAGIRNAHQFLTFAVSTPMQHAAAAAITGGQGYIEELVEQYLESRDYLGEHLSRLGFDVIVPEGTYFIMADHRAISEKLGVSGDIELAKKLTSDFGVATIPPSVFCDRAELASDYLRFAFCKQRATLEEAVRRLERLA
ncbi:MAG: aminotransferase class I/II-fold pyridoxal phosphate-dependent enzyme [Planctomycetota bacterium]